MPTTQGAHPLSWTSVRYDAYSHVLIILDQRKLPAEVVYHALQKVEDIWQAIYTLQVRGAPAIGIAAAWGFALAMQECPLEADLAVQEAKRIGSYLSSARPTAVNLSWAIKRMEQCFVRRVGETSVSEACLALFEEAANIQQEDADMSYAIGEHALTLLKPGMTLLTHCNAGALATARYGTALAPIYLGQQRGYDFKVYADETRPLLQGARLTAWELVQLGVDTTLICDNMAAQILSTGCIDAVLIGADRVAANGDTANKIGSMGLAILAKAFGVPFYVLCPSSTLDASSPSGSHIVIEQRADEEVTTFAGFTIAPLGVKVYNPAFDVTPASYISAIITEKGIVQPPYVFA